MKGIMDVEICSGMTLHVLTTKKFKTVSFAVFIHDNLNENAALNALIPYVIKSGNAKYGSVTEINEHLESMYGASFDADVVKKGDIQSIMFYMQFVSDRYAKGEGIFKKSMDFMADMLLLPMITESGFDRQRVEVEKAKLEDRIASRINDKVQYAVERCLETAFEGQPFAIYRYGDIRDIKAIDEKRLYDRYREMVVKKPVDMFIAGDFDVDETISYIKERFALKDRSPVKLRESDIKRDYGDIKVVIEEQHISQGKLCLGFKTGIGFVDERYAPLSVFTGMLGGGTHSRLFKNVREKEGLAYYSYAGLEKFKGYMVINSGIDKDKYDAALHAINEQINDLKSGNISDTELEESRESLRSDLLSINDSMPAMIDYWLGGILSGRVIYPEEMIESIMKVDKEQLYAVAGNIKLDTIYFMEPAAKG